VHAERHFGAYRTPIWCTLNGAKAHWHQTATHSTAQASAAADWPHALTTINHSGMTNIFKRYIVIQQNRELQLAN
jgi:hypothetical protein